jgi:ankyrin repeat protein
LDAGRSPVPTPAVQEGRTALMMAVQKGQFNMDVVRCLLDNYADVNLATKVRSACNETSELSDGLCDVVILPLLLSW